MSKKERFSPPASGGISLLVIFVVLCLTVFALLGMAKAQSDDRLSKNSAESVEKYYAADTMAEEIYAEIREGKKPSGVSFEDNGQTASYSVAVTDDIELRVEVKKTEDGWKVINWKTKNNRADEVIEPGGLDVWTGGTEELE